MGLLYVALFIDSSSCGAWLERTRLRFDPKALLVRPHVTLVFPTGKLREADMLAEALSVSDRTERFRVGFSELRIVEEEGSGLVSLFLLAGFGVEKVFELHRNLYSGQLSGELRKDIPYLPHVTLGTGMSLSEAEAVVGELSRAGIDFEVSFKSLSVVRIVDGNREREIVETLSFGGR